MTTATAHRAYSASATADSMSVVTAAEHDQDYTADSTCVVTATEHDQDDKSIAQFYDIVEFLSDALVDVSGSPPFDVRCLDMVLKQMEKWASAEVPSDQYIYNESALLKHKEIFDIARKDKEGNPKEDYFLRWCRKVYAIREAEVPGHAEASEDQEKQWYKTEDAHGASYRRPPTVSRQAEMRICKEMCVCVCICLCAHGMEAITPKTLDALGGVSGSWLKDCFEKSYCPTRGRRRNIRFAITNGTKLS